MRAITAKDAGFLQTCSKPLTIWESNFSLKQTAIG